MMYERFGQATAAGSGFLLSQVNVSGIAEHALNNLLNGIIAGGLGLFFTWIGQKIIKKAKSKSEE